MRTEIGIMGLGPIGGNLAAAFSRRDTRVVLGNRTAERARQAAAELPGDAVATASYQELAGALARPRVIMVLVAPNATADVLAGLADRLEPGDILIDGGNSAFDETENRQRDLWRREIHLLGTGVASGVDGALTGLSATTGGDPRAYRTVQARLESVGARIGGRSCCLRVGPGGTGHFVKMVHNGVEYSIMQLLAEIITFLRADTGAPPAALAETLASWNSCGLASYIVQVAAETLARRDELTGAPFVDVVADRAIQHGSGRRAAQNSLALGVPSTLFAEASLAWFTSCDEQRDAAGRNPGPSGGAPEANPMSWALDALRAAMLVTYAQAFRQIAAASAAHDWRIDLPGVITTWQGACVRSAFLDEMIEATRGEPEPRSIVGAEFFVQEMTRSAPGWRRTVQRAVELGVPTPCLSSALSFFDGIRAGRSSGALIQAMRSRLGGNPYERVDRVGTFRTDWNRRG